MSALRIAVFHDLPPGGAKRVVREQVRGLVHLGHEVHVLVPSTANEEFLPLAEVVRDVSVFPRAAPPPRGPILAGRLLSLAPLRWVGYLRHVRAVERRVARTVDQGGYHLALVHPSQFTQAPFLLRFLRTPSIYYCHEPLRAAHEPRVVPPATRWLLRYTLGRIDRTNLRRATAVAVNSQFTAERVAHIYGRTARVIRPGVDTDRFRALDLPAEDFVLTVSALEPTKGVDFVVRALARLDPEERAPLVVVGNRGRERDRTRVLNLAHQLGVQLTLWNDVPEDELVRCYNRARVVVYAPYDEPLGLVSLEAMACGRPVLAVAEGGVREAVRDGETGFLVRRNVEEFAARLRWILTHPHDVAPIAVRALDYVRREWNWKRSVAELAALCHDVSRQATHHRPLQAN